MSEDVGYCNILWCHPPQKPTIDPTKGLAMGLFSTCDTKTRDALGDIKDFLFLPVEGTFDMLFLKTYSCKSNASSSVKTILLF